MFARGNASLRLWWKQREGHGERAAESSTRAAESSTRAAESSTRAAESSTRAAESSTRAAESSTRAAESSTRAAESSTRAAESSTRAAESLALLSRPSSCTRMNRIVARVVPRYSAAALAARRWTSSVVKPQVTQREGPLPLSAMPGPSAGGWLHLVQVLRRGGLPRIHQISQEDFDTYGPVYRQKLGSLESVNVLLPSDAAHVFGVEGARPERQLVDSWMEYRKHRRRSLGVLLQ
ncbi:uncharacterized protein LOC142922609 [Petromyzon marinus]|uniref:uncharacterized protein LOC142922609 n=1 Tax=Petromyzon marinus TaxID=7757 RepID=UPI003F71368B